MEDIEYLEEYEDLILPTIQSNTREAGYTANRNNNMMQDDDSSSIDQDIFESLFDDHTDDEANNILQKKADPKLSQRGADDRASLDSLDMLVKDLVGEQNSQKKTQPTSKLTTNVNSATSAPKGTPQLPKKMSTSSSMSSTSAGRVMHKGSNLEPAARSTPSASSSSLLLNNRISRGVSNKSPMARAPMNFQRRSLGPSTSSEGAHRYRSSFPQSSRHESPQRFDKTKSVATVRPTLQHHPQQHKRLLTGNPFIRNREPSSNLRGSSSSLLTLSGRKQLSTRGASSASSRGAQPSRFVSHNRGGNQTRGGLPGRKTFTRGPTTIVKVEKPSIKEPAEDPLNIDDITDALLESDTDSFSLSDISDGSMESSDLDSSHQIIDISNDSSVDDKMNKDLENVRRDTPSPTVSDVDEESPPRMKSKTNKLEASKDESEARPNNETAAKQDLTTLLGNNDDNQAALASQKKPASDKVTILSDTLLTRIDTALLDSVVMDKKNTVENEFLSQSNADVVAALERELMPFLKKKNSTDSKPEDATVQKSITDNEVPNTSSLSENAKILFEELTESVFSMDDDLTHTRLKDQSSNPMDELISTTNDPNNITLHMNSDIDKAQVDSIHFGDFNNPFENELMNENHQKGNIEVAMEVEVETVKDTDVDTFTDYNVESADNVNEGLSASPHDHQLFADDDVNTQMEDDENIVQPEDISSINNEIIKNLKDSSPIQTEEKIDDTLNSDFGKDAITTGSAEEIPEDASDKMKSQIASTTAATATPKKRTISSTTVEKTETATPAKKYKLEIKRKIKSTTALPAKKSYDDDSVGDKKIAGEGIQQTKTNQTNNELEKAKEEKCDENAALLAESVDNKNAQLSEDARESEKLRAPKKSATASAIEQFKEQFEKKTLIIKLVDLKDEVAMSNKSQLSKTSTKKTDINRKTTPSKPTKKSEANDEKRNKSLASKSSTEETPLQQKEKPTNIKNKLETTANQGKQTKSAAPGNTDIPIEESDKERKSECSQQVNEGNDKEVATSQEATDKATPKLTQVLASAGDQHEHDNAKKDGRGTKQMSKSAECQQESQEDTQQDKDKDTPTKDSHKRAKNNPDKEENKNAKGKRKLEDEADKSTNGKCPTTATKDKKTASAPPLDNRDQAVKNPSSSAVINQQKDTPKKKAEHHKKQEQQRSERAAKEKKASSNVRTPTSKEKNSEQKPVQKAAPKQLTTPQRQESKSTPKSGTKIETKPKSTDNNAKLENISQTLERPEDENRKSIETEQNEETPKADVKESNSFAVPEKEENKEVVDVLQNESTEHKIEEKPKEEDATDTATAGSVADESKVPEVTTEEGKQQQLQENEATAVESSPQEDAQTSVVESNDEVNAKLGDNDAKTTETDETEKVSHVEEIAENSATIKQSCVEEAVKAESAAKQEQADRKGAALSKSKTSTATAAQKAKSTKPLETFATAPAEEEPQNVVGTEGKATNAPSRKSLRSKLTDKEDGQASNEPPPARNRVEVDKIPHSHGTRNAVKTKTTGAVEVCKKTAAVEIPEQPLPDAQAPPSYGTRKVTRKKTGEESQHAASLPTSLPAPEIPQNKMPPKKPIATDANKQEKSAAAASKVDEGDKKGDEKEKLDDKPEAIKSAQNIAPSRPTLTRRSLKQQKTTTTTAAADKQTKPERRSKSKANTASMTELAKKTLPEKSTPDKVVKSNSCVTFKEWAENRSKSRISTQMKASEIPQNEAAKPKDDEKPDQKTPTKSKDNEKTDQKTPTKSKDDEKPDQKTPTKSKDEEKPDQKTPTKSKDNEKTDLKTPTKSKDNENTDLKTTGTKKAASGTTNDQPNPEKAQQDIENKSKSNETPPVDTTQTPTSAMSEDFKEVVPEEVVISKLAEAAAPKDDEVAAKDYSLEELQEIVEGSPTRCNKNLSLEKYKKSPPSSAAKTQKESLVNSNKASEEILAVSKVEDASQDDASTTSASETAESESPPSASFDKGQKERNRSQNDSSRKRNRSEVEILMESLPGLLSGAINSTKRRRREYNSYKNVTKDTFNNPQTSSMPSAHALFKAPSAPVAKVSPPATSATNAKRTELRRQQKDFSKSLPVKLFDATSTEPKSIIANTTAVSSSVQQSESQKSHPANKAKLSALEKQFKCRRLRVCLTRSAVKKFKLMQKSLKPSAVASIRSEIKSTDSAAKSNSATAGAVVLKSSAPVTNVNHNLRGRTVTPSLTTPIQRSDSSLSKNQTVAAAVSTTSEVPTTSLTTSTPNQVLREALSTASTVPVLPKNKRDNDKASKVTNTAAQASDKKNESAPETNSPAQSGQPSFLLTPLKLNSQPTLAPTRQVAQQQNQQNQQKRSARLQQANIVKPPTAAAQGTATPTNQQQQQQKHPAFTPIEPKKEVDDDHTPPTTASSRMPPTSLSISSLLSGGVPATVIDNSGTRMYTFLHPAKYNRSHGAVLLDYCCPNLDGPMPAIDPTRDHAQLQSLVRELPSYIVMTTRVVTRADLEAKNNTIPASIRKKMERLSSAVSGTTTTVTTTSTRQMSALQSVSAAAKGPPPPLTPAPAAYTGNSTAISLASSTPLYTPNISALQKQLPPTTTLTPKLPTLQPIPPPSVDNLPPLTPFSTISSTTAPAQVHIAGGTASSGAGAAQSRPDFMRSLLRSNLRRFDALLKKYSPRISELTYVDRQRIVDALVNQATYSIKDVETITLLLDDYCQLLSVLPVGKPATLPTLTATINTSTSTTASRTSAGITTAAAAAAAPSLNASQTPASAMATKQLDKLHASAVQKVRTAGAGVQCQRQVPIYDKDRNIIGYQMHVGTAGLAATNSTMSTRSGIMSTQGSAMSRQRLPAQSTTPTATPPALKQPAQESPRIFYTKPIQTSTPIANNNNKSNNNSSCSSSNTSTSSAAVALEAANRLGRSVTIRQINTKVPSQQMNTSAPRTSTLTKLLNQPMKNMNPSSISTSMPRVATTLPTLKTPIPKIITAKTVTPKMITTQAKRVTRNSPSSKPTQVVLITTKDKDGNSTGISNDGECILPDNERAATDVKEIKEEREDETFIGGS